MSPPAGAVVIPAAPMFVPGVAARVPAAIRDETAALCEQIRSVLATLAGCDVVLVLAGGDARVWQRSVASLAPLGVPGAGHHSTVPPDMPQLVAEHLGYELDTDGVLGLAHSALALQVAAALPDRPVLAVAVPPADPGELIDVAGAIADVVAGVGAAVGVVAGGDLSAATRADAPRAVVPGAVAWDEAAVRAVTRGDVDALESLGPAPAREVHASGWSALVVVLRLASRWDLHAGRVTYGAPRGVGALVTAFGAA